MSIFPLVLASTVLTDYCRITYPAYDHQKPTYPYLSLIVQRRDWHCDGCGRDGRIMRVYSTGLITCPRCESRFVVPCDENEVG